MADLPVQVLFGNLPNM